MALVITIDGIDRTEFVEFGSINKRDTINSNPDVLSFRVRNNTTDKVYKPPIGKEIILVNNGTKIFGGVITKVNQTVEGAKNIVYTVTCNDYEKLLKRELVTNRYEDTTVKEIIDDVVATHTTGFTTNNVASGTIVKSITFNRSTVKQVIQRLADLTGLSWYVDYDRDVHFFTKNAEPAPFNIDDTSGNYNYKSLNVTEDIAQIRNSVLVEGDEIEGEERSVTKLGAALSDEGVLDLEYKFSKAPAVTVDGVPQQVGVDFLDDDVDFDVMWSFQQKYLRFTTIPTSGQEIVSTGIPLFPIVVRVTDDPSIAEFGLFEHAIKDNTIRDSNEAIERAIAELSIYANDLVEGGFTTNTDGLRSGMVMNIQSDIRGVNEDVLIQNVTFRQVTPDSTNGLYSVKFATLKTLGIIEFLQKGLRRGDIVDNEIESLLSFLTLADSFACDDAIGVPETFTAPYKWADSIDGEFDWNVGTWA